MNEDKCRIGILASGSGSNLQTFIDAVERGDIAAEIVAVISNNSKAKALERARKHNIKAVHLSNIHYPDDRELDLAFITLFRKLGVNLVLLCGYMKKRGPDFIAAFRNRILNVHPALIPKHCGKGMYGMKVHESVIASGDEETGVTIHIVNEEYDRGPIVAQRRVPVLDGDTPETLQKRVLEVEHSLFPEVVARVCSRGLDLDAMASGETAPIN
ncbi:MAG: phosphoribosylglycinamide formyltransferase [bacterium]|nr:phosphoribosylglycinamide formyltransferase [bacterium]